MTAGPMAAGPMVAVPMVAGPGVTLPVFTIGYQGTTLDQVVAALTQSGVAWLVDVRAVPASRKPGFAKRTLAAGIQAAGMSYVHIPALGTPAPGREAARRGDAATMHRIFRAHMETPAARDGLAEARAVVRAAPACLLCFERDPALCHRTLVAEALGLEVRHLMPALPPGAAAP